jgi:hypothetical protein
MSIAWLSAGSAIYDLEIVLFAMQEWGGVRVGRALYFEGLLSVLQLD